VSSSVDGISQLIVDGNVQLLFSVSHRRNLVGRTSALCSDLVLGVALLRLTASLKGQHAKQAVVMG
jgi:hypothetical protein